MPKDIGLRRELASKEAVVFDLFHTLVAIELTSAATMPTTAAILSIERSQWKRYYEKLFDDARRGKKKDPFAIIKDLVRVNGPFVSDDTIKKAVENRLLRFERALLEVPQQNVRVLETLRMNGKKTALVSNADVIDVHAWQRSPLKNLFDAVVFSCDVGYLKPEPEIFRICMDKLGTTPQRSAYVGDGGSEELSAARRLGFMTIMTTAISGKLWPEELPGLARDADFVVSDLMELIS